ncbi:hypothetical protein ACGFY7_37085 [Streptomyces prunicolor]|uniref:hypothetical protein n=1 Tax=Streptomyces prunicolor TaxID=67348 RepID=UPI00371858D9
MTAPYDNIPSQVNRTHPRTPRQRHRHEDGADAQIAQHMRNSPAPNKANRHARYAS